MGQLKHVLHGGTQAEQHELLLETVGTIQHFDKGRDSGAIDVADRGQVECQLAHGGQRFEKSTAEFRGGAEIHLSVHVYNSGSSHVTNGDLHLAFLECLIATKRFPSGKIATRTLVPYLI